MYVVTEGKAKEMSIRIGLVNGIKSLERLFGRSNSVQSQTTIKHNLCGLTPSILIERYHVNTK